MGWDWYMTKILSESRVGWPLRRHHRNGNPAGLGVERWRRHRGVSSAISSSSVLGGWKSHSNDLKGLIFFKLAETTKKNTVDWKWHVFFCWIFIIFFVRCLLNFAMFHELPKRIDNQMAPNRPQNSWMFSTEKHDKICDTSLSCPSKWAVKETTNF